MPVPSPARARRTHSHIPILAAEADCFKLELLNYEAGELLVVRTDKVPQKWTLSLF